MQGERCRKREMWRRADRDVQRDVQREREIERCVEMRRETLSAPLSRAYLSAPLRRSLSAHLHISLPRCASLCPSAPHLSLHRCLCAARHLSLSLRVSPCTSRSARFHISLPLYTCLSACLRTTQSLSARPSLHVSVYISPQLTLCAHLSSRISAPLLLAPRLSHTCTSEVGRTERSA